MGSLVEIKNAGKARLFNRSILEIFTVTNPIVHFSVYGGVILSLLFYYYHFNKITAPYYLQTIIFISGFIFWTLFEYLMHRYLFHIISNSHFLQRFQYILHGNHHEFPRDEQRLFMPPVPGLLIISILQLTFYLILRANSFLFVAAMIFGYVVYSLIHYSIHKFKPPHFLRSLWLHHSLHHYQYNDKAYGVSSPLWDHIFGTMPYKEKGAGLIQTQEEIVEAVPTELQKKFIEKSSGSNLFSLKNPTFI